MTSKRRRYSAVSSFFARDNGVGAASATTPPPMVTTGRKLAQDEAVAREKQYGRSQACNSAQAVRPGRNS